MKYLKKFEKHKADEIEVGDYVKIKVNNNQQENFMKMMGLGIGKVSKIIFDGIIVDYDTNVGDGFLSTKTAIRVKYHEVLYKGKTKEELEIKLASNKYNL